MQQISFCPSQLLAFSARRPVDHLTNGLSYSPAWRNSASHHSLPDDRFRAMTNFSPTTQAVLDAFRTSHTGQGCLAAALRAAAHQENELEVPFAVIDDWEKVKGSCASFYAAAEWGYKQAIKNCEAIANELDPQ
jgi:hypothetical protein